MTKKRFNDNTVTQKEYDEVMEIVQGRYEWIYGKTDTKKLVKWCNENNFFFWSVADYFDKMYRE